MSHKLDRQKGIYDEKVHGVPFKQNDLVWLPSTVVPQGCGRKLHRSWTGPFKVVKQLADSILSSECSITKASTSRAL